MLSRRYSLVTVAHEADFQAMQLQARSLAQYCPRDLVDEIIVIENFKAGSRFSWRDALLKEYSGLADLVRFISPASFGPIPAAEGWWSQQLFKLQIADTIRSDLYLVLDAKNHLVKMLDRGFLQDEAGRARIYAEGYRGHPLEFYFNEVCRYFALDRNGYIDRFITTAPPFLMYTTKVKDLMQVISRREGRPFAEFFIASKKLTEFFLYGGYLAAAGELELLYAFNDQNCPTIWGHTTSYENVKERILSSLQGGAPFFGIHRTAFGKFDDATVGLIADYWLEAKLFPDRVAAIQYLHALRCEQRRQDRQKFLTSLLRRILSRMNKIVRST